MHTCIHFKYRDNVSNNTVYVHIHTHTFIHARIRAHTRPYFFFQVILYPKNPQYLKMFLLFLFPFLSSSGYMAMEKQRQRLPAYKHRSSLLYLVENHATTIIMGETGSGKTTQIPQVSTKFCCLFYIIYESRITKFNIYYNYK